MSKERYEAIERHAVDCWIFIGFMATCALFAYINTL